MPGVIRVIRPEDVPHNINTLLSLIGFGRDDEALLQGRKVSYVGETIVAVVAETELQARNACKAVQVDYEILPHVLDVEEAMHPDAPVVNDEYPNNTFDYHELYDHQKLRFGDVEKAFSQADHIVEGEYQMSPIEQAPTETCGAIAAPEQNDRYVCYTSTQALFFSLGTTAKLLEMPSSKLHFVGGTVGGGFGGKVDSLHEPLAVLGARLTGKPVKYTYDRQEEMQVGAPRGAERWRIKDGVMNDGRIVARKFTGFFDSGAYTRLSSYAIVKGTGHLPGPYTIPNVSSNVYCVYTNRTPATAMRGFGITGVDFSIECHMDKVAEKIGMNPIELRILNAYRDGDMKAHRRLAKNCALIECAQVAAQKASWPIAAQYSAMSSLKDGGGARAEIPATMIDNVGKIGERRTREVPAEPAVNGSMSTKPPSTIQFIGPSTVMTTVAPEELARPDLVPPSNGSGSSTPQQAPAAAQPTPPVAAPAPSYPAPSYVPPQPAVSSPPPAAPTPIPAEPYKPAGDFQRGTRRPGSSPFISGRGRR
jgi:CO/xanthine dehydrogenase Mo-binding subunit